MAVLGLTTQQDVGVFTRQADWHGRRTQSVLIVADRMGFVS